MTSASQLRTLKRLRAKALRDPAIAIDAGVSGEIMVRCAPYQSQDRGPLDRVAQIAERKDSLPQARPFCLGFPRKVPVFPICPPAAL
jgi:hypothetical protein